MPWYVSRYDPFVEDDDGNQQPADPAVALAQQGPVLVPVVLTLIERHRRDAAGRGHEIVPVTGAVLIDTGASVTCFDRAAAEQAGLPVGGTGFMSSASHPQEEVPLYTGALQIPGFGELAVRRAMGAVLANQGIIALLGRDALRGTLLVYNGIDGSYILSR